MAGTAPGTLRGFSNSPRSVCALTDAAGVGGVAPAACATGPCSSFTTAGWAGTLHTVDGDDCGLADCSHRPARAVRSGPPSARTNESVRAAGTKRPGIMRRCRPRMVPANDCVTADDSVRLRSIRHRPRVNPRCTSSSVSTATSDAPARSCGPVQRTGYASVKFHRHVSWPTRSSSTIEPFFRAT
jgi:hypothetical protein